jgi:PEP-CTERM motif
MIRSSLFFPTAGLGVVVGAIASGMSVPEPAIFILLGLGILCIAFRERRRKRMQEAERAPGAGRCMTHGSDAPIPLLRSARRWNRLQSPRKRTTPARLIVMALSNGIIFNGCNSASRDIPLSCDPGNEKTQGSGVNPQGLN